MAVLVSLSHTVVSSYVAPIRSLPVVCSAAALEKLWNEGQQCVTAGPACGKPTKESLRASGKQLAAVCKDRISVTMLLCQGKDGSCAPEPWRWTTDSDLQSSFGILGDSTSAYNWVARAAGFTDAALLTFPEYATTIGLKPDEIADWVAKGVHVSVGTIDVEAAGLDLVPATWEALETIILPTALPDAARGLSSFSARGCDLTEAVCPVGRRPCALQPGELLDPVGTFVKRFPWMAQGTSQWPDAMRKAAAAPPLNFSMTPDEERAVTEDNPAMEIYRRRRGPEFSVALASDLAALGDAPDKPGACELATFVYRSMAGNQFYSGVAEPCETGEEPRCSFTYGANGTRGESEWWLQNGFLGCVGDPQGTAPPPEYCSKQGCPKLCASIFPFVPERTGDMVVV